MPPQVRERQDQAIYADTSPLEARLMKPRSYSYIQKQFTKLRRTSQKVVKGVRPSGAQRRQRKREHGEGAKHKKHAVVEATPVFLRPTCKAQAKKNSQASQNDWEGHVVVERTPVYLRPTCKAQARKSRSM